MADQSTRHTADTITDDDLDALYDVLERHERRGDAWQTSAEATAAARDARCRGCGRRLRTPESRAAGLGPVCRRALQPPTAPRPAAVDWPPVRHVPGQTELPLTTDQQEIQMPTALYAASACPESIRIEIKKTRAAERRHRREAEDLEALLEARLAQIAAGTWPARPADTPEETR